jgi:folylpolyglutamate synthase/dihydropteroate synthase
MILTLGRVAARFLLVPIRSQRAAAPAEIERLVPVPLISVLCASVEKALELAHHFSEPILVTGSLFLVGETLAILNSDQAALQTSNQ